MPFSKNILLIPAFLLFSFIGFSQKHNTAYINLPVATFKTKINQQNLHILLDVRTPEEFAKGHLPGAVNINFFSPDFKDQVKKLDAKKPVYVYCAVGGRSAKASTILASLNRKEVFNMEGGFTAWQKANLPIQK